MKIGRLCIIGVAGLTAGLLYGHEESVATRLKTSSEVLTEIMTAPDSSIPQELLEKSQCIVIVQEYIGRSLCLLTTVRGCTRRSDKLTRSSNYKQLREDIVSDPFYFVGHAPRRFIVHAVQVVIDNHRHLTYDS